MTASDKPGPGSCDTDDTETPEQASVPSLLPDEATIISEEIFTSPKGRQYRIIRTNQTDVYDAPAEETAERRDPGPSQPGNHDPSSS